MVDLAGDWFRGALCDHHGDFAKYRLGSLCAYFGISPYPCQGKCLNIGDDPVKWNNMEISDGCANVLLWLIIATVVGIFLVLPIILLLTAPEGIGWGYPLVSIGVFSYFVAMFFDFEDNKFFNIAYYVFISFATMLLLRDLFAADIRAGLDLVLSVPVGFLIYRFAYEPLAEGMSATGQELLLKGLGLLGNMIVNGLIFLILRYFLPA